MTAALAVLCAVLGLAIGSFLNVVIWRVPRGESVVSPPSACPKCGNTIRNRHNVPVLGWLVLRGRCHDCGEPISARYPLVEAGTGALFAVMAWRFGLDPVLPAFLFLAAIGVALAMIDLDTQRLPDVLTKPAWVVTPVLLALGAVFDARWAQLERAGFGALGLWLFYLVLRLAYPAGMGLGDVKLAPTLGAFLGWVSYGAVVVGAFTAFLYGGVVGIALIALTDAGRKSKVPFGPFMLAGALTGILVGTDIAHAYTSRTFG
jgi:leader peptidase (prepilin peptidase)/N-methyltransferase